MRRISQDRAVYFINYMGLMLLLIIVIYPLIFIVSSSFSSGEALMTGQVWLFPVDFTLDGYTAVFGYTRIWRGFMNSIIYTVSGTILSVILTLLAAYPLSREDFRGNKFFTILFLFTMMFNGGLIPTFLLIRNLGMIDTIWAIILPGSVSAFNMIIARTFFRQSIPKELKEAAEMDGCEDFNFFIKIVVPLSKPIIAVLSLWVIVALWNAYFIPLIYLNSQHMEPLQLVLRRIILLSQVNFGNSAVDPAALARNMFLSEMLRYGTIVVSTIPLMVIYPFVQKHFVKGVMIGSVKG